MNKPRLKSIRYGQPMNPCASVDQTLSGAYLVCNLVTQRPVDTFVKFEDAVALAKEICASYGVFDA